MPLFSCNSRHSDDSPSLRHLHYDRQPCPNNWHFAHVFLICSWLFFHENEKQKLEANYYHQVVFSVSRDGIFS